MTLPNIGAVVGSNSKVGNYCVAAPNFALELQDFVIVTTLATAHLLRQAASG